MSEAIRKTQAVRLADVYVIGPAMVTGGALLRGRAPLLAAFLVATGISTSIYNWHNLKLQEAATAKRKRAERRRRRAALEVREDEGAAPPTVFHEPDRPAAPRVRRGIQILGGAVIQLEQGTRYRARLGLSGAQCAGSRDAIASRLSSHGFRKVRVFMKASELPSSWPKRYRSELGAGCTRWAQASWTKADRTMTRPAPFRPVWSG